MSAALDVVLDAQMVARRRTFVVSDETVQRIAQALLDMVAAHPDAEQTLAKAELGRKAKAQR